MRAFATPLILLALLAACSALPPPPHSSNPYAPLRASIAPPGPGSFGNVSFHINRPAHVAVFEIIPGRGIAMVYPSHASGETYLAAGMHSAWTGWQSSRWAYFPGLGGQSGQQPRFLYLVASEAPLRIAEFRASPMALRSALGWRHFTAWNPYAAMEELTHLILPAQAWGEWATDLYVQWPDPAPLQLAAREQPRRVMVVCQDGRRMLLPVRYGLTGCPGDRIVSGPIEGGEAEEGLRTPTRHRPEPTAATGEEPADLPRTRPEAGEGQPEQPARPRRGAVGEAGERERVRPRPAPTHEAGEPRAEPRRRGTRGTEPRSEARPARPARSQEPRAEPRQQTRPARPAPPARSAPRAEPRRNPPARSSGSSERRERRPEPQAQQH